MLFVVSLTGVVPLALFLFAHETPRARGDPSCFRALATARPGSVPGRFALSPPLHDYRQRRSGLQSRPSLIALKEVSPLSVSLRSTDFVSTRSLRGYRDAEQEERASRSPGERGLSPRFDCSMKIEWHPAFSAQKNRSAHHSRRTRNFFSGQRPGTGPTDRGGPAFRASPAPRRPIVSDGRGSAPGRPASSPPPGGKEARASAASKVLGPPAASSRQARGYFA